MTYEEIRRERIERIMRPIDADTITPRRKARIRQTSVTHNSGVFPGHDMNQAR